MGWHGKNGRGFVLDEFADHDRVVTVASFAKSFGCGGAALTFPNLEMRRRVKTCGGPMIFCGPIQPPILGALIASVKLHLSDEIYELQADLERRITYFNEMVEQMRLPLVGTGIVPIRFVGVGPHTVAYNMVKRLMQEGFYTNLAAFPAVPIKRSGVRLTITNHQSLENIRALAEAIAHHLPLALAEENSSIDELWEEFKFAHPKPEVVAKEKVEVPVIMVCEPDKGLRLEAKTSIDQVDREEWDRLLGSRGSFTWDGLKFLEDLFQGHPEKENNWKFHYYIVRDETGNPVLATFFTESIWKDDVMSPADVSSRIEEIRMKDPYFLTSLNLTMGSQLTEGNHLYLDHGADWRGAMGLMMKEVFRQQARCGANNLILRDLPSDDLEMDEFLLAQGFSKMDMPETCVTKVRWKNEEEYLTQLSGDYRRHVRKQVLEKDPFFRVEVVRDGGRSLSEEELKYLYRLYLNVKQRGLDLNTFDLPRNMFSQMMSHPGWEISLFYHREVSDQLPVGFSASYASGGQYVFLLLGLDYRYSVSYGVYRQVLMQTVRRAIDLGCETIYYGFDAVFEKKRFGARPHKPCMYVQSADHYQAELLAQFMAEANVRDSKKSDEVRVDKAQEEQDAPSAERAS